MDVPDFLRSKRIAAADQIALVVRAQAGDRRALDELVRANVALCLRLVRRYRGHETVQQSDLFSEALLALTKAVDDFEVGRGNNFATYMAYRVRSMLRRRALQDLSIVRHNKSEMSGDFAGRQRDVFLDAPAFGAEPDGPTNLDRLLVANDDVDAAIDGADRQARTLALLHVFWRDLRGQRAVIFRRHIIEGATLQDIGAEVGRSRQRVHQVKEQILADLRDFLGLTKENLGHGLKRCRNCRQDKRATSDLFVVKDGRLTSSCRVCDNRRQRRARAA
jgi:RNA polymerase sigma factor (sigma-70 family)